MNLFVLFLLLFLLENSYSSVIPVPKEEEDANLTVPQLIEKYGFTAEEHFVTTTDGYILRLHRIPYPPGSTAAPKNQVAFLMHGILSSSADWIMSGTDKALAYQLSLEGYDVWMGNGRGNALSRNHTTLDPDNSDEFWKYSWEEYGTTDIPTMIDYVLDTTGKTDLFYVGHSQGTTAFFVMATMRPEYNTKIKAQFSLAPIMYMNHMTSPILHFLAYFEGALGLLFDMIGMNEFLPNNDLMALVGDVLCGDDDLTQTLCSNVLFAICGFSPSEMNSSMLPILMGHTPAGSSSRQILHYAQEIVSGHYRRYDYGWFGEGDNNEHYGTFYPPEFDLTLVTAPVYLFYSHNDWLSAETDVLRAYELLPNAQRILVSDGGFNHLDYLFGIHAYDYVYSKVISLMSRYDN